MLNTVKYFTENSRRKGKKSRLNIWKGAVKSRILELSDKSKFLNGKKFPNTLFYIRAAAGSSIGNRGLSLLSACGYFFALHTVFNPF